MSDHERLRWIALVAQAIRIMAARNPVTYAATIQEYAHDINLMALMPDRFIDVNKENFERTEQNAAVIAQMGERLAP